MNSQKYSQIHPSFKNVKNNLQEYDPTKEDTVRVFPKQDIQSVSEKNSDRDLLRYTEQEELQLQRKRSIENREYIPPRHHLDGSEMKKILKHSHGNPSKSKEDRKKSTQKSESKNKHKDQVIYVAPSKVNSNYGEYEYPAHFIVRTKSKSKAKQKKGKSHHYYDGIQSRGSRVREFNQYWQESESNIKEKTQTKVKKNQSIKLKEDKKNTKNIRTQCTVQKEKKLPFVYNNMNPNTDDQFSDFEF